MIINHIAIQALGPHMPHGMFNDSNIMFYVPFVAHRTIFLIITGEKKREKAKKHTTEQTILICSFFGKINFVLLRDFVPLREIFRK